MSGAGPPRDNPAGTLLADEIVRRYLTPEEGMDVPKGQHMRGVGGKEQRQYEHIKESAQKSGRYGSRAKEVAARTVMKEHKRKGHAKGK
jgi:hypothetical protein